jgi:diguanylate cyclase (GGDEF)-like protein
MEQDTSFASNAKSPEPGDQPMPIESVANSSFTADSSYLELLVELSQASEPELLNESLLLGLARLMTLSSVSLGLLNEDSQNCSYEQLLQLNLNDDEEPGNNSWNHIPQTLPLSGEQFTGLKNAQVQEDSKDNDHRLLVPAGRHDIDQAILCLLSPEPLNLEETGLATVLQIYQNLYRNLNQGQRDKLTGLLNRQTFDSKLNRMLERQQQLAAAYSDSESDRRRLSGQNLPWLAIIDIDHFKRVNDRFGHVFGDEVILTIGQHIRSCFRKSDLLFRFGGEEFVVVLEPIPAENVVVALERLRSLVARQQLQNVGQVTVSIGYAAFTPNAFPPKIIDCADQALYYAKEHGRNQVASYEDLIGRGELTESQQDVGDIDLF